MLRSLSLVAVVVLASGCHAKFKKEAPTLGAVDVQVITNGGPYVELGKMGNPLAGQGGALEAFGAIASTAVNIAQEVEGINQTERIANAVQISEVNRVFDAGIARTLDDGPPFAYTADSGAPATLQLEVLSYGLYVPWLGAPGTFTYTLRARIYKSNGDRVYSSSLTCEAGMGMASPVEQVLSVVNNVEQIEQMSDAEIQESFLSIADWCADLFVTRMRKHAG